MVVVGESFSCLDSNVEMARMSPLNIFVSFSLFGAFEGGGRLRFLLLSFLLLRELFVDVGMGGDVEFILASSMAVLDGAVRRGGSAPSGWASSSRLILL